MPRASRVWRCAATSLAQAFQDVGFLTTPLQFREGPTQPYQTLGDGELPKFSRELRDAMAATEGGTSRFGALAEVLNGILSKRWKMFTPPYCLLLIRTFLTLEGIAAQVRSRRRRPGAHARV